MSVPQPEIYLIGIRKEKAVTLNPLLPDVYDSYLLNYGRPGIRPGILIMDVPESVPESGRPGIKKYKIPAFTGISSHFSLLRSCYCELEGRDLG